MKMQKKLAGFSACALVLSSLTVPVAHAASVDFKDIDSHWAKSSIERWAGYEIVNGFGNDQFKPEDTMTRAQMAQILSKTLGLTATTTTNPFTDVSDSDWFADAILKCNAAGIMNGTSATTAKPNAQISRQEAVTMMGRALGIEADGDSTTFDDNSSIGDWAVGFVNAMAKRGIVNGRSEGVFAPTGDIKRGEITTILDRAITTYVNTPDTEVTATGKGITLIAAPGVTVKGEAEDILVAPAATGTTKLDSVKVSGAVTMQAANGVLVLSGTTTAAKLNVPALATGAKITIEQNATVAAMNSAADNVTVDGSGNITEMTVAGGKGVTVAGAVKVGKITNNGSDPVTKGNTTVAANTTWSGTTTNTGGGGGGGGGGGHRNPGKDDDDDDDHKGPVPGEDVPEIPTVDPGSEAVNDTPFTSVDDFVEQAQKAAETVTAKMDESIDSMGNFTVVNDAAVDTLTLDLSNASAGTVAIRAKQAKNIVINGTGKIEHLTIEAPNATVENNVAETGEADVEKVGASTYKAKKKHTRINMKGKGHLDVASDAGSPVVNISTPSKDDAVTVSGAVETLNVNSAVKLTLNDIVSSILNLISSNKNVDVTIAAASDTNTGAIKLSGSIGNLTANNDITLDNATVTTATVADNVIINAEKTDDGVSNSNIGTLNAVGAVEVNASVEMLKPQANATITVGASAVVTSITTTTSITLAGAGTVASVDVKSETKVTITKTTTVVVAQVTALGSTSIGNVETKGEGDEEWKPEVLKKAEAPENVTGSRSDTWGAKGSINGATAEMEYRGEADDAESWKAIPAAGSVDSGTYFVRVKEVGTEGEEGHVLASEPVRITVPAQVGVTKASILGSAIIGQILTADANPDADDVNMKYSWSDGETEVGTDKELTVLNDMAGKTITVTISNYDGSVETVVSDGEVKTAGNKATSKETEAVTADMTLYNKALKEANHAKEGVIVEDDAAAVPTGMKFVNQAAQDALETAITDAAAQISDNLPNMANVEAATTILTDATAAYEDAKQDGTGDITTAQAKLADTIKAAQDLLTQGTKNEDNGLSVAPTETWYTQKAADTLNAAITTASALTSMTSNDDLATVVNGTNTLANAMKVFRGQIMNGAPIDVKALDKAVADALANVSAVTPAADEMYVGTVYAPADAISAYRTAITIAMTATISPAHQKAVLDALEALNTATDTFNGTKSAGTTIKGQEDLVPKNETYTISLDTAAQTLVTVDKTKAAAGATVTVTAVEGKNIASVTVTGASGDVSVSGSGPWTFTMPAENVTVSATETQSGATSGTVTIGSITYVVNNDTEGTTLTTDAVTITPSPANGGNTVTISIDKTKVSLDGYTLSDDVATVTLSVDDNTAKLTGPTVSEDGKTVWEFTMPQPAMDITVNVVFKMSWTDPNA